MKLSAADLDARAWVPDSGWPLPYTELSRYYPEAARVLGLPAIEMFEPERHRAGLSEAERALFESDSLAAAVSLWGRKPKRFGAAALPVLRRSRNVRLVLQGNATGVELDEAGTRVQAVQVATLSGRRFRVRARAVVLACGGLENARLLLVSRDRHTRGVGNAHDLVGRYFMDHPRAVFGRVRLNEGAPLSLLEGRPLADGKVQLGIGFSPAEQRERGLLDHYATLEVEHSEYTEKQYQSFVRLMKILLRRGYAGSRWKVRGAELGHIPGLVYLLAPRELLPHAVYRWTWHARRALFRRRGGGTRVVVYFCEQPPDPESRVLLSRDRDRLGMNRLVLRWKVGPAVRDSVDRLQELLATTLERTGAGVLEAGRDEIRFTDASHHMGTTRMSDGPRTGVVDTDGRVHGVEGLYVAGSSVFPSASHKNPTLTIVALALRLADHLLRSRG
jgi:choline dehydrogenase-like flavoprotein